MVSWSTWLNAFVPTGSIYLTHWYSAKRGKLGFSLLRSIKVTGLCVHMTSISALKFTVVAGPQYIQGTLEDLRSALQCSVDSAHLWLQRWCHWWGNHFECTRSILQKLQVWMQGILQSVLLYTKTLMYMWHKKTKKKLWRAGKFLQGVLVNCCIHTELQWFGFSQQLLV